MNIDDYKWRLPKPNYLTFDPDYDKKAIVEEYRSIPLAPASDADYAAFEKKVEHFAQEHGIVKPKGHTVSFHYNPDMEQHHFGLTHPMKPWRLTLTKSLVGSYGMIYAMENYTTRAATEDELKSFHNAAYIDYLAKAAPEDQPRDIDHPDKEVRFNLGGSDCPLFQGLYNYCSLSAGGALDAARKINCEQSDIAIAWGGGLHHAKKMEASGFCYINDIVLAIRELLFKYPRVLYIDIDVHHGDGVEEAFFSTDRVLTVSFHKYQPDVFFPGTGALEDNGPKDERNPGAHHAINVPLNDGITDEQYENLFQKVIGRVNQVYRPSAIALQCGADSLAGDRLGRFNLQVQGHGACVTYCKKLNLPMILFGGGGYTPRNVARAWAHETSIAIDMVNRIPNLIPEHTPYRDRFLYGNCLFPTIEQIFGEPRPNRNTQKRLQEIVQHVHEQLRFVEHAPSSRRDVALPDKQAREARDDVERRNKEMHEENSEELRKRREKGMGVHGELAT